MPSAGALDGTSGTSRRVDATPYAGQYPSSALDAGSNRRHQLSGPTTPPQAGALAGQPAGTSRWWTRRQRRSVQLARCSDAAGNPVISYLDYTNHALKLARWTAAKWNVRPGGRTAAPTPRSPRRRRQPRHQPVTRPVACCGSPAGRQRLGPPGRRCRGQPGELLHLARPPMPPATRRSATTTTSRPAPESSLAGTVPVADRDGRDRGPASSSPSIPPATGGELLPPQPRSRPLGRQPVDLDHRRQPRRVRQVSTSLRFDPGHNPAIATLRASNGSPLATKYYLKLLAGTGPGGTSRRCGACGRLRVAGTDQAGNPAISYFDEESGDLDYAAGRDPVEHPDARQPRSQQLAGAPMRPAGGHRFFDYDNRDLEYTAWDAPSGNMSGWIPPATSATTPHLALDAAGHPAISYFDITNSDLKSRRKQRHGLEYRDRGQPGFLWGLPIFPRLDASGNPDHQL